MKDTELDVAIAGGGLAGNLLARQLRLARPDLRVGIFEKETGTSFKVGEATVEIAANHLLRKQRLSTYLYEEQLPKNGLRYFFDDESRSLPLERMSEVGSINLPFHPTFQLDRAKLEADLIEMNRRDGIEIRTGVRVDDVELGTGGERHRFAVRSASEASRCSARWFVDAAGRGGLLARPLGLRTEEPSHRLGSVWGRFEGVVDIDDIGSDEFRGRVRHAPRRLSTIHFWYPGYWIWFIPLRGGLTSVGVTGARVGRDKRLRTPEGFREFLEEHRAVASLLEGAKAVDIGSYARIAYGTRRFFSPDRWGLTGEAATSADPLYSPGSDFIALENDFLTDLITRDIDGRDRHLAKLCSLYDEFMRFRQEATILLYAGLYDAQGSFEITRAKWDFDIGLYYNLWVSSYFRDQHLDPRYLRKQLRLKPYILKALENFANLFRDAAETLRERGDYFRGNADQFYYGLSNISFTERVGLERSEAEVDEVTIELFNTVRAQVRELLGDAPSRDSVTPLPLTSFLGDRPLL